MRYIYILLFFVLFTPSLHAKFRKIQYVPNPGDILLTLHGNIYNYNINSDVRETNSEVLLFGYAKLAYHLVNGLYAGGVYHRLNDDENEKNSFGINVTYVYKILHIGGTYLFHSNHKYRTDTLNAELEKGHGFLLDATLNFPVTRNFYVGLGATYHSLKYGEVDYEDTSITDSTISDEESYFMPMLQLSYFFGTHGRRIHDKEAVIKKKRY